MRFPFFASFIIFLILFSIRTKKTEHKDCISKEKYWEREHKSNSIRRKTLDNLDYIVIPYQTFPTDLEVTDNVISQCIHELQELSEEKIVNFTGFTNTDLKLEYGTANITPLSKYDQNFTILVRILQDWARRLYELNHPTESLQILEFAIAIRTDISGSYYLAAKLYTLLGMPEKISHLKQTAQMLNSVMKNSIVRTLQESYPDID